MKNTRVEINDAELEKVAGGYTIKPDENTFWYSYNPAFSYNWGDNWGDEGYFGND